MAPEKPYDFSRSVGLVETRRLKLELPPEGFLLESGEKLPEVEVAYESYGTLSPARDNAIYICHALSGDSHAAGFHSEAEMTAVKPKPGWWDVMIGPGKPIDTNHFFVVCSNFLSGCKGTTGPSSIDPRTGKPYGSRFPSITVGDMVEVQHLFLEQLGVPRLLAVLGGSMGGMQVLEWTIRFADFVDRCICIASAAKLTSQALAFNVVGRRTIMDDPDWQGGDYYETGRAPAHGLSHARMLAHITYMSPANLEEKFGRDKRPVSATTRFVSPFQVESYLAYQGEQFVKRFDANSYLHIAEALDSYDLEEKFGSLSTAFLRVKARYLIVALNTDWLYPPEQSLEMAEALLEAGREVSYCLLEAEQGHDAFLLDLPELSDLIRNYLHTAPVSKAGTPHPPPPEGADYPFIRDLVKPGARILDLGCGDGELLAALTAGGGVPGLGFDIEADRVIAAVGRGVPVFIRDIDDGLAILPDQSYDVAILSRTLQVIRKPAAVLREMMRVARIGIVTFPNFANWKHRLRLLSGRMPKADALPYEWHDTPNIHLATLTDFLDLCAREGIRCSRLNCVPNGALGKMFLEMGLKNLGADEVIVMLERE
ncbi:MAG: homoserine O-acetyltransferase [Kiritimatiellia bacterium]